MNQLLRWAIVAIGLTGLAGIVASLVLFDLVLSDWYWRHRVQWEALGSPPGFFWWAPRSRPFRGMRQRDLAWRSLLTRLPAWVVEDQVSNSLVRRFRRVSFAAALLLVIFVLAYAAILGFGSM